MIWHIGITMKISFTNLSYYCDSSGKRQPKKWQKSVFKLRASQKRCIMHPTYSKPGYFRNQARKYRGILNIYVLSFIIFKTVFDYGHSWSSDSILINVFKRSNYTCSASSRCMFYCNPWKWSYLSTTERKWTASQNFREVHTAFDMFLWELIFETFSR